MLPPEDKARANGKRASSRLHPIAAAAFDGEIGASAETCYAARMNVPAAEARIHRDCPSCGAPSADAALVAYSHPDWPMKQCVNCDLIFLEWVPNYSALYDEIGWTRQHKIEEERRLKQQPILARLDMMTRWRLGLLG